MPKPVATDLYCRQARAGLMGLVVVYLNKKKKFFNKSNHMLYELPRAEWLYKVGTNTHKLQVQAGYVILSKDSEQFTGLHYSVSVSKFYLTNSKY